MLDDFNPPWTIHSLGNMIHEVRDCTDKVILVNDRGSCYAIDDRDLVRIVACVNASVPEGA